MADELRKQVRDAAAASLTGLTTTGSNVFPSRTYELQDGELPALRVYTNNQQIEQEGEDDDGVTESNSLELVVECCAKASDGLDDELDQMIKEVRIALADGLTGTEDVALRSIQIDMEGEAEKDVGVARMTFEVGYFSARGVPDVSL